ncbi:MAG: hypothetical protein LBR74_03690 [Eubacterium sp.]|jgi:hypothetical protein|nr:hypothetical protein [Eubacterium sp.]
MTTVTQPAINARSLVGGGCILMNDFIAKSPRQLDLCLKLLYAENISFVVAVRENDKRKIEYLIRGQIDEHKYEKLLETYRILIS